MDDDHEIIDDDLDYILLFDKNEKTPQNSKAGCCVAAFFLFASISGTFWGFTKIVA